MPSETSAPAVPSTTTVAGPDEAVVLAVRLLRSGRSDEADELLGLVLRHHPDHADALHFRGLLLAERGDPRAASEHVRRSLDVAPLNAAAWNNLGNLLLRDGKPAEAGSAYVRCLELVPHFPEALSNIGLLLRMNGEIDEAERLYRRALEANPKLAEALNNLGAIALVRDDAAQAESLCRRALECEPRFADAYLNLGRALAQQGRHGEAADCFWRSITSRHGKHASYRLLVYALVQTGEREKAIEVAEQWLKEMPDDPRAIHHHAAVTGRAPPVRAADGYVETMFDSYAESFDGSLEKLDYRAPALVAEALAAAEAAVPGRLDILDAGCGTGLCGPLLRARAGRLDGIDLSAGMLARAERRELYDRLDKEEITAAMAARPGCYDAVISADTLCYFGDLHAVLEAGATALRAGGCLVFTVEADETADGAGFRLHPGNGRYAHSRAHVEGAARAAGLEVEATAPAALRTEGAVPVAGYVVTLRKPSGSEAGT